MIEIVPNWHPIMVHFTIAFFVLAAVLQCLIILPLKGIHTNRLQSILHWVVVVAAVSAIATVLSGFGAYNSVAHDDTSHRAMTDHRNWALLTALVFFVAAVASFALRSQLWIKTVSMLLMVTLLVVTAHKGGDLVYRYGLGVMSLPIATSDGHDHDHGTADAHDHGTDVDLTLEPDGVGAIIEDAVGAPSHDHAEHDHHESAGDQALFTGVGTKPAATVERFHEALRKGDLGAARALLDADVRIFEGGGVERSAEEYASHHMKADAAFLKDLRVTVLETHVDVFGDTAIAMSRRRLQGQLPDHEVDAETMETMVLKRTGERWIISRIHWSN